MNAVALYEHTRPASRVGALLFGALIALSACGDDGTGTGPVEPITELPRPLSTSERQLVRASNHLAFELARRVSQPDSSFFLSPLSASMALGMAANGAEGETLEQMREVLGFEGLTEEQVNASYRDLLELLLGLDSSVELAIGNSGWIREGFPVLQPFQERVGEFFGAEFRNLDFDNPSAAETMNAWVRDATNDRIESIIEPPIDEETVMFLLNAVFFKGTWTTRFDRAGTRSEPFHLRDGSTVDVPMMKQTLPALFYSDHAGGYAVVDMPYGGEAFSMTVVVPAEDVDLHTFLQELDANAWAALVDRITRVGVTVTLPRFTMVYGRTLNDDLTALGMIDAFDRDRADFSRIHPLSPASVGRVFVDQVKQKTFVRVDEEGTEAAAATSVRGNRPEAAPPEFRADRPFLFAIRERFSGTILFLGAVVEKPVDPAA